MKKILFALATTAMVACNNTTTITGTTDDSMEGATAYLVCDNTNEATDSCTVTNKTFTFTRTEEQPCIYRVQIGRSHLPLLYEAGQQISVDFTGTNSHPVTDNGGANTISNEFTETLREFIQAHREKFAEIQKSGTPEEAQEYSNRSGEEMAELYKKQIALNKDNIFGAYLLANLAHNLYPDLASLDSVMNAVKYAKDIKHLESVRATTASKENTKEGKPFVDFEGKDLDGNPVALSKYVGKGKYTLIDFWASWCGPCRGEIPNLKELHKLYGGEIFEVVGVNVWDNEQKFKESLIKEEIEYPQIFVPADVNATSLYGIQGIPQIMLIGPDGTILKRDLRGEEMKAAVAEALGK